MANVKDIISLCKAGNRLEAYEVAKADLANTPSNVWIQREMAWSLYYMIKHDAEVGDYVLLLNHIDELVDLELLTVENDNMIFDNIQFKIAEFVKSHVFMTDIDTSIKLSSLFARLRGYCFKESKGHSYLLQCYIKFEAWPEMADFIEWWNLDTLSQEDYVPYVNSNGQKMMTLAERAFIANSKALLRLNDAGRIEEFLPKLDTLMSQHDEMMYPGYFYGKLLLALGNNAEEALKVIIPFAQKKSTEFWVWQLLSDVFINDEDKQLACLLRAVHCRTQESFLGKVRIKLAALYIKRMQFNNARYHIDAVTRCYASHGWRLPYEIDSWIHQPWLASTTSDGTDPIDYKTITDEILCDGAEECVAVVSYVDQNSHKASLIYGYKHRMSQKIRFRVNVGNILKLYYTTNRDGVIKVLSARKISLPNDLTYAKYVEGVILKREDSDFAFIKIDSLRCYVSPTIVNKYNLHNGDNVRSLIVYDFNRRKEEWNWISLNVKK